MGIIEGDLQIEGKECTDGKKIVDVKKRSHAEAKDMLEHKYAVSGPVAVGKKRLPAVARNSLEVKGERNNE